MNSPISRRTLAKGAAWTGPAVVASTALPAYASSTCALPSTAKGYP